MDRRGFALASGVPCSYFAGPIEVLSRREAGYVGAANEGAALAIAVGAALGGSRSYVMLQNSGLGNLVNPLTSLAMSYDVPVLCFVSLRGFPDPSDDEPQHEVMGRTTHALLDVFGLHHGTLRGGDGPADFARILDQAEVALATGQPAFVLVEKGAVGPADDAGSQPAASGLQSAEVMKLVARVVAGHPVIASTGYISRELFGVDDRATHFYVQGSMGHASGVGLGLASQRSGGPVVVIEGDGAALMHLGTLSTIGAKRDVHLLHIILDNGTHESTGGQATTSPSTSFVAAARAMGYSTAVEGHRLDEVATSLMRMLATPGTHLCVVPVLPRPAGSALPRVTSALRPPELRARFLAAVGGPGTGPGHDLGVSYDPNQIGIT